MAPQQFFVEAEDYASLTGQVAVVTGGSSGIGLATVEVLLETGAFVVVGDLNPPPIEHKNLSFLKTNVAEWSNLLALFALASEKHGRVDHTFANAGVSSSADFLPKDLPPTNALEEPSSRTFDLNAKACMNTAYIGIHYLRTQETPGSVVLAASACAFQVIGQTDYCTSKHAVLGFMRGIVSELPANIRINCIGPSFTLTGMLTKEVAAMAGVEAQEAVVVGKQVAVLMADERRKGEFIYSVGGRNYEIEKSVLLPAASVAVSGGQGEWAGFVKFKELAG